MIIELSKHKVELKDKFNYGEMEDIQETIADLPISSTGSTGDLNIKVLRTMQNKALELAVVSIKEGENSISYSRDWIRGLDMEDATKLIEAVTTLMNPKKK
jgi:hypothetical protein